MADYIDFPGKSGNFYRYWFLANRDAKSIKTVAGNYMFIKQSGNGWVPVYIGQAQNLSERISTHERWKDAVARGATNAVAHTTEGREAARLAEERDLIEYWKPSCNTQYAA